MAAGHSRTCFKSFQILPWHVADHGWWRKHSLSPNAWLLRLQVKSVYLIRRGPRPIKHLDAALERLSPGVPVRQWAAVDGFDLQDEVLKIVDSGVVEPAALPRLLAPFLSYPQLYRAHGIRINHLICTVYILYYIHIWFLRLIHITLAIAITIIKTNHNIIQSASFKLQYQHGFRCKVSWWRTSGGRTGRTPNAGATSVEVEKLLGKSEEANDFWIHINPY